jgi:hypothetical protein
MRHSTLGISGAALLLMGAADAPPTITPDRAGPVLMDGACADRTWQEARAYPLADGASVRFAADREFLYICVTPPPESYANVDLYIGHGDGIDNLHASAQLGERRKGAAGWPDYQWWNHRGWAANWTPFTGMRLEGERPRARFGFVPGREFQIARSKYPRPTLGIMVHVHELATPAGPTGEARFPAGASDDAPGSWARLQLDR